MGSFFAWVFGVSWLLASAGTFFENQWLGGSLLAVAGLSMLPRIHQRTNAFLKKYPRHPLARALTTGHGSWALGMSLFTLVWVGMIEGDGVSSLSEASIDFGDAAGMAIVALIVFFIFRSIRDKISAFMARAKGSPLEETPSAEEQADSALEAGIRAQLKQQSDQASIRQLNQLRRKFSAFEKILESKFEQQELTYGRYLHIVEDAYLGCMDNLSKITEAWAAIAAIDSDTIRKQLAGTANAELRQTLEQRLALVEQTHLHVGQLRSANEMAMTRLDEITIQLSRIQTRKGHSALELNESLKELSTLAQGTQMYDMKK
jgi:hypothetical protein